MVRAALIENYNEEIRDLLSKGQLSGAEGWVVVS
jgi:hypothetical protein